MNLAYRMRPTTLDEFIGQEHLVGKGKIIRNMIEQDRLFSMILWGPPGVGKTTLAQIIANQTKSAFYQLSGVTAGKDDVKKIVREAEENKKKNIRSILFIDEVHRWNKVQQDVLLPYVESGLITLIGATTENPSFEINSALLSRCRVFVLQQLSNKDLEHLISCGLEDSERGLGKYKKTMMQDVRNTLILFSGGDGRVVLNGLEMAVTGYKEREITKKIIEEIFQKKANALYDKKGDEHYNIISAYIKSLRGSDVDAALYYLLRMLENGEDPTFIARRMIIFASEDIGMADRGALIQANAAFEAVQKIGMPESKLLLTHITIYLARAQKSRAVANALQKAQQAVFDFPTEPIPLHLRNAQTKLMREAGYAKGYTWSEEYVGPDDQKSFLPEQLKGKKFYEQK